MCKLLQFENTHYIHIDIEISIKKPLSNHCILTLIFLSLIKHNFALNNKTNEAKIKIIVGRNILLQLK